MKLTNSQTALRAIFAVVFGGLALAVAAATTDVPVSPGDAVEVVMAPSACPTFSWATVSNSGIELVVARLDASEEDSDNTLYTRRLPPGASSWTPAGEYCLASGQYLWFFRALDAPEKAWSQSLTFEISPLPTQLEVENARRVLERYLTTGTVDGTLGSRSVHTSTTVKPEPAIARATAGSAGSVGNKGIAITDVAILGYFPGASGDVAGVTGKVDSATGAGVVAENTADGVDLLLPGSSVSGAVSENRWVLDAPGNQTFDFSNPSGNLTVRVNGSNVLTTAVITGSAEPASMFGPFGGAGTVDRTISGTENLDAEVAFYRNLTVPAGTTLVINRRVSLIAVSGTCDISGTIVTTGFGMRGGDSRIYASEFPGMMGTRADETGTGYGMTGGVNRGRVMLAVSGGGGGGGGAGQAPMARGGDGGGAESYGGEGGYPEFGTFEGRAAQIDPGKRSVMTGGASDNLFPDLRTDFFATFIYFPGAGGGGGAIGASGGTAGGGGYGGSNVYLECRSARFTGLIDTRGANGQAATGFAGGGGGGGGGVAILRTLDLQVNTGTTTVIGGLGGPGSNTGGNGGNGRAGYSEIVGL